MSAWLTVVGIGEDGLDGLSPAARALVDGAEVLVGGERHLAKVPDGAAERLTWAKGFRGTFDDIADRRGRRITVLASGDPLWYGAASTLARHFGAAAVAVVPAPGAFTLAAARMGWPMPDVETLTVHGRPVEMLNLYIAPGARLLVLSRDGTTPGEIAALLRGRGFGPSVMTVLADMGGPDEARVSASAGEWPDERAADLNTIAIECRAGPGARILPRVPGLPEEAFEHDGQITKREVRAVALARLAPGPGEVLWDVGAGSGAVAIEWLRAERTGRAVAIERHPGRAAAIARNALALGVPGLAIVEGEAPAALDGLSPSPHAVFAGGGVSVPGLLDACWAALPPGGRMVANAVTLQSQERLLAFRREHGGDMTRIEISRAAPIGAERSTFRPFFPVTQYSGIKP